MNVCLPSNLLNLLHHENNFLREYIVDKYYDLSIRSAIEKNILYLKIDKDGAKYFLLEDDKIVENKNLSPDLFEESNFIETMESFSDRYVLDPLSLYCFDSRFPDSEKMKVVYDYILKDIEIKKSLIFN